MIVDSSATTGRPAASAAWTAGDIWETVGMDPTIPVRTGRGRDGLVARGSLRRMVRKGTRGIVGEAADPGPWKRRAAKRSEEP